MIGQTKLLNLVDDYIKNGFTKSLILSGECGCVVQFGSPV